MKMLTDKQVADKLGVGRQYVWTLVKRGLPAPIYIADTVPRWRESDIDSWIDFKAQQQQQHLSVTPTKELAHDD